MVDRNDASIVDIDTSMRLGAGHPMGPLHLADYIGTVGHHCFSLTYLVHYPQVIIISYYYRMLISILLLPLLYTILNYYTLLLLLVLLLFLLPIPCIQVSTPV